MVIRSLVCARSRAIARGVHHCIDLIDPYTVVCSLSLRYDFEKPASDPKPPLVNVNTLGGRSLVDGTEDKAEPMP